MPQPISPATEKLQPADAALIDRILDGDEASFELLMRRNNQRLFRAARSIVGNSPDAEDVLQEAYIKAFHSLARFERRSSLGTWLMRITVNEALTRAERASRVVPIRAVAGAGGEVADDSDVRATGWLGDAPRNPEAAAGDGELRSALASAVEQLPDSLRTVFILRSVEGMSVEETADCLELTAEAVRVRLHRARAVLRDALDDRLTKESRELYAFGNERCDRVVAAVLNRTRAASPRKRSDS